MSLLLRTAASLAFGGSCMAVAGLSFAVERAVKYHGSGIPIFTRTVRSWLTISAYLFAVAALFVTLWAVGQ